MPLARPIRTSNLNGAIPTQYDPNWPIYTDLSPAQIAAFQAFPQDLVNYIGTMRWQTEICAFPQTWGRNYSYITLPSGIQLTTDERSQQKIASLKQAIDNGTLVPASGFPFSAVNGIFMLQSADLTALYGYVVRWVQATYVTAAKLVSGVNSVPQVVTERAQVDAAFQAIIVQ